MDQGLGTLGVEDKRKELEGLAEDCPARKWWHCDLNLKPMLFWI